MCTADFAENRAIVDAPTKRSRPDVANSDYRRDPDAAGGLACRRRHGAGKNGDLQGRCRQSATGRRQTQCLYQEMHGQRQLRAPGAQERRKIRTEEAIALGGTGGRPRRRPLERLDLEIAQLTAPQRLDGYVAIDAFAIEHPHQIVNARNWYTIDTYDRI